MSRPEKVAAFRALHEGEPFVIPNPWDAGSAHEAGVVVPAAAPLVATPASCPAPGSGRTQ